MSSSADSNLDARVNSSLGILPIIFSESLFYDHFVDSLIMEHKKKNQTQKKDTKSKKEAGKKVATKVAAKPKPKAVRVSPNEVTNIEENHFRRKLLLANRNSHPWTI